MVCMSASLHPSLFQVRQPGCEVTTPRSGPASQVSASGYEMTEGLQLGQGLPPTLQVCQLADLHLEASGPKDRGTESGWGGRFLCLPSFTLLYWLGDGTQGAPSPKSLRCI